MANISNGYFNNAFSFEEGNRTTTLDVTKLADSQSRSSHSPSPKAPRSKIKEINEPTESNETSFIQFRSTKISLSFI